MNNDRFRFRVWDNAEQRYLNPKEFVMDSQGKIIFVALSISDHKQKDITIEQCTGLKDSHGNLIFEGDVVSDMGVETIVGWYSDKYMIEYDDGSIGELAIAAEALEVIGNIHESEREENE